ncbi:MAG: hypothetical protein WC568_08245 [Candidatus Methanoperedens sp.]
MLTLLTSIATILEKQFQPVITEYDLSLLILKSCNEQKSHIITPNNNSEITSRKTLNSILSSLQELNIISKHNDFAGPSVYSIVHKKQSDVSSIACAADPFLYISHLTAMNLYGLSNIISNNIYITEPKPDKWLELAEMKMLEDKKQLSDHSLGNALPPLIKPKFTRVGKSGIVRFADKMHGQYKLMKNSNVRLSTLGRTFYDMLSKPNYCGDMQHVLDVFKEFAPQYGNLIIEEIDTIATPIEKVRAGFILEEYCGIKNPIVESWIRFCQRGGSRKLDPSKEYKSVFSERWCLSINL